MLHLKFLDTSWRLPARLELHPDYFRMLGFLEEHDTEPVFLSDEPAFDMGSAILLLETAEEESVEI